MAKKQKEEQATSKGKRTTATRKSKAAVSIAAKPLIPPAQFLVAERQQLIRLELDLYAMG